jgi:predicted nuclease with RNAse H fold
VTVWTGVDVGARRKGFHVARVDERRLLSLDRVVSSQKVVDLVVGARLVAVDSPRTLAEDGRTTRDCERELVRAVCGIRWTPDRSAVMSDNPYYEWVRCGLELYEALEGAGVPVSECFPTAAWTRWGGPRGSRTRARWSRETLAGLDLEDVPHGLSQDWRDAIAAALTAQLPRRFTERFGPIVVPAAA